MTAGAAWPDVFDVMPLFGPLHLATASLCIALAVLVAHAGRIMRRRGADTAEWRLRHALALAALVYWLAYNLWWNWDGIDWRGGLPLHICDLNGLIAPLALVTCSRSVRALLYFWTFALTSQAFIQPALTAGPAHLIYYFFWAAHTLILACALYDIAVRGFRPGWGDLARAGLFGALYVAAIVPLDLWLDANYGFIGDPRDMALPPFVAALGPWPQRAIVVVALAALAQLLALLPWLVWKRDKRRSPATTR
jgi:hypothetical integral membrane protein (TIGR02206 family)